MLSGSSRGYRRAGSLKLGIERLLLYEGILRFHRVGGLHQALRRLRNARRVSAHVALPDG